MKKNNNTDTNPKQVGNKNRRRVGVQRNGSVKDTQD